MSLILLLTERSLFRIFDSNMRTIARLSAERPCSSVLSSPTYLFFWLEVVGYALSL
jgi:hypothetical protein